MAEKVEIIAELKDLVSGKFAEINKQIEGMDSKLSNINGKGGIMGQVVGANLLSGAIMRAGSAITDFAKESFRAYGEAEQFQVALTTLLYGNADAANALNNQLKQFALETPFELTELQQATKLMIAYGSSAGTVVDELRVLGDVAAGTAQPVGELAYLYGTVRTQGQATLIDLRQFANRGIPIYKELAKVTKYTSDQIVAGGKDINISFQDVEKAFKNMTAAGSQYGGLMQKQSQTLLGQTSNLSDAWEQLKVSIGQSQEGILKSTVAWATQMISEIGRIGKQRNFFDEATKGLQEGLKVKTGGASAFWADLFGGKGQQYSAFNRKDKSQMQYFGSKGEREAFLKSEQGKNYMAGGTVSQENLVSKFSDRIYELVQKAQAKPEDANKFEAQLREEKVKIAALLEMPNRITASMAATELSIIDKALKDVAGIKGLKAEKDAATKAAKTETPKELEHVAKGNRPTQIIVNIDNLVNELTNNISSARDAKQMTAEEVSKALLSAVNDVYAVGQ